jgi:hypothetical protein
MNEKILNIIDLFTKGYPERIIKGAFIEAVPLGHEGDHKIIYWVIRAGKYF